MSATFFLLFSLYNHKLQVQEHGKEGCAPPLPVISCCSATEEGLSFSVPRVTPVWMPFAHHSPTEGLSSSAPCFTPVYMLFTNTSSVHSFAPICTPFTSVSFHACLHAVHQHLLCMSSHACKGNCRPRTSQQWNRDKWANLAGDPKCLVYYRVIH